MDVVTSHHDLYHHDHQMQINPTVKNATTIAINTALIHNTQINMSSRTHVYNHFTCVYMTT